MRREKPIPLKVYLGPQEIAGLMWAYRCGLRKIGVDAKVVLTSGHRFGYEYDELHKLSKGFFINPLNIKFMHSLARKYDLFHFFFGKSIMGPYTSLNLNIDVPILKILNKPIVMSFLGSDIRCNTAVLEGRMGKEDCSFCGYPCNIERKKKSVKYWAKNADHILGGVDMSQLLDYYSVPYSLGRPAIDTEYWKAFPVRQELKYNGVLVVFASSSAEIKGGDMIRSTMKRLDTRRDIHFEFVHEVSNRVVREWLNAADIVIDRVHGRGWYGMGAVESMSLGKPTISYITDECMARIDYTKRLPLVNVYKKDLYDTMVDLIDNPELRNKIGEDGRKYVLSVHDDKKVAKELLEVYRKVLEK